MAAPVAGKSDLPVQNSDLQLTYNEHGATSDSPDNLTISQLKTIRPNPTPPAPVISSLGKRKKSKPLRYGVSENVEKTTSSHSKLKIVLSDPSGNCLSSPDSAVKSSKLLVERSPAVIRAREIQASLGTEYPSCIKLIMKAHVGTGYWMGFPQTFSKLFLPQTDTTMVIEDENGGISQNIRYIAQKCGLSAGWKKFADEHNLCEGDVLVFQLVAPIKFKVYIVRANEVDGALGLLTLEAPKNPNPIIPTDTETPSPAKMPSPAKKSKRPKSLPLIVVQKKRKLSTPPSQVSSHPMEHSGNDSEDVGSEVLEGSRSSRPELSLQELKTFEDLSIVVNGMCIDSELPDDVRMNYYKLCIARKELLHDALPEGLYSKLVAGMIGETVHIANEMKKCKLTTTKQQFEAWDNSLNSFALLGMKVGFLRDRIRTLERLVFESEGRLDVERYVEAENEQKRIEDEIKQMTEKLEELKESCRKMEGIADDLKQKVGRHEVKFQAEVGAPW